MVPKLNTRIAKLLIAIINIDRYVHTVMNDADCTIRECYKLHNSLNLQLYNQTLDQLQEYLYLSTFKYEYLLLYLISWSTCWSTCIYT